MLQAKDDFNRIQAMMRKVVSSNDEFIHEVQEGLPTEIQVYHAIGVNLKIRVYEKPAPLTINFSYPENPNIKNVQVFYSFTSKEPDSYSKLGS